MKKYHYTECGLDNIYLINGFEITKSKEGTEIFIHDIYVLHKKIGELLVFKRGSLVGNEIKFMRTTLDLSQKALGKTLGLDYQTILNWEKNKATITRTADHLLRITFYSYLNKKTNFYDKINEIAELDAQDVEDKQKTLSKKIELKEVGAEWQLAA